MKRALVVLHLPLVIAVAILVVFSTDAELFAPLKTEETYGYWVVVGVPAAALLLVAQVISWIAWIGGRSRTRTGG